MLSPNPHSFICRRYAIPTCPSAIVTTTISSSHLPLWRDDPSSLFLSTARCPTPLSLFHLSAMITIWWEMTDLTPFHMCRFLTPNISASQKCWFIIFVKIDNGITVANPANFISQAEITAFDSNKKQTNIKTHWQSLEQTDFVQIENFQQRLRPCLKIQNVIHHQFPRISHDTPNSFKENIWNSNISLSYWFEQKALAKVELSHRSSNSPTNWPTDWATHRPNDRPTDRPTNSPIHRPSDPSDQQTNGQGVELHATYYSFFMAINPQ